MHRIFPIRFSAIAFAVASITTMVVAQRADVASLRPGYLGGGITLLPNGWRIAPAGRHMPIGDLPLAMVLSPDGHSLVVTNNGYQQPTLRVVDLDRGQVSITRLDDAWLGLTWHPDGARLYSSGAASNTVQEFGWVNGRLRAGNKIPVATQQARAGSARPQAADQTFVGGIAISADGSRLF